jgi:hypothetical protein
MVQRKSENYNGCCKTFERYCVWKWIAEIVDEITVKTASLLMRGNHESTPARPDNKKE